MDNQENYSSEFKKSLNPQEKKEITDFLASCGLSFEEDIEETAVIRENGKIIATGSISGNILKCIAVGNEQRGSNLTGDIVTALIQKQYYRGITELFIFTKPENRDLFKQMGFTEIHEVQGDVVLMENNPSGISSYIERIRKETGSSLTESYSPPVNAGDKRGISAIVVNCNPFTRGHLYLVEKAAAESRLLHIFVVSENRSVFPSEVRFDLVKKGTAHLKNIAVHHGGNYIISGLTFPSYFIKDTKSINDIHARMDIGIFSSKIAPPLGITRRFAGEEPLCPVTANYNRLMKEILPENGIEFTIIKRLTAGRVPVSASRVRSLIREGLLEKTEELLPPSTFEFLRSPEGEKIIKKIRGL